MKITTKICAMLLAALPAFGALTSITGPLYTPAGDLFGGTITVTLNNPAQAQPLYNSDGRTLTGFATTARVTGGSLTLSLEANDVITPAGTSYTARFQPDSATGGGGWSETWIVPTSGVALKVLALRSTTVPIPALTWSPSQLSSGGATSGQYLRWSGTSWSPYTLSVLTDPTTTTGDILYRSSGGTLTRLGIGTAAQVLTVSSGIPAWQTPSGAVSSVFGRTGAITATSGDYTAAQVTNAVSTAGSYADPAWITSMAYSKLTGTPSLSGYVSGAGALTTTNAVPYVTSSGTLGQDQYLTYTPIPVSPVAGDVFTRLTITDATGGPVSTSNYQTHAYIGGKLESFSFTPSSQFVSFNAVTVDIQTEPAVNWNNGGVLRASSRAARITNQINGTQNIYNALGLEAGAYNYSSGVVQNLQGVSADAYNEGGDISESMNGAYFSAYNAGTGTIGYMRGFRNQFGTESGTVTVAAGMEIESLHYSTVGTSYMLRTITSGDTTPTVAWDISAETGHNSRIMGNLAVGAGNTAAPTVDLFVFDASAGGSTKLVVRAGDTQSTTPLQEWQDNSGTVVCSMSATGAISGTGCPAAPTQAQALTLVSFRF